MTKVVITGSKGRMGQSLIACAPRFPEIEVIGKIDLGDDVDQFVGNADVLIDFSFHNATAGIAEICARNRCALVIGTTGHSDEEKNRILGFTKSIPMVWASNYSTGVNALFWLARKAAEILGPSFDLEIVEMHHRLKFVL